MGCEENVPVWHMLLCNVSAFGMLFREKVSEWNVPITSFVSVHRFVNLFNAWLYTVYMCKKKYRCMMCFDAHTAIYGYRNMFLLFKVVEEIFIPNMQRQKPTNYLLVH